MFRVFFIFVVLFIICQISFAEPVRETIRERIKERMVQKVQEKALEADANSESQAPLPDGVRVERGIAYGSDKQQSFDVYIPAQAKNAPVIFMVHGGAWSMGDKSMERVVKNKVARWVPKGFIFITTNYRLLPNADPLEQARDVVSAIAVAQAKAESWGGDSSKFILMGH